MAEDGWTAMGSQPTTGAVLFSQVSVAGQVAGLALGGRSAAEVVDETTPRVAVATSIHTTPSRATRSRTRWLTHVVPPRWCCRSPERVPPLASRVLVLLGRDEDGHGDLVGHRFGTKL